MKTIKNYLDTMFQNLPATPEVMKAKAELLSMMEDKYSELIKEGHTENEAIGTVISEFGNLDELAEELGLHSIISEKASDTAPLNFLTLDEAASYLHMLKYKALFIAFGVLLCITCSVPVILLDLYGNESMEMIGVVCLLVMAAVAVAFFINAGILSSKYDDIRKGNDVPDHTAWEFIKERKAKFHLPYALVLSTGIMFCILSAVPAIILDTMPIDHDLKDALSGALTLIIVAIGVFMIVTVSIYMGGLKHLLRQRYTQEHAPHPNEKAGKMQYTNPIVAGIMSVYWPTVTCIYLMWSFITYDWRITWLIWPIAGIFKKVMNNIWSVKYN